MFHRMNIVVSCLAVTLLAGCSWFGKKEAQAPAAVGTSSLKVVNVLDKNLYDDAHIAGSIQVDFENVKDAAEGWNKNDTVVFYCSNYQCQASFESARQLKELGFNNVMAFEGGMEEWYRLNKEGDASYKVEGPGAQDYLKMKIAKPEHTEESAVKIITAAELKDLMSKEGLL